MRLIDADELEELFREVIGRIAKRPDINFNMEHMIRASAMVVEMIKDAPTVTPEPHWIPVTKQPPEVGKSVLICDAYGDICLGHRTRGGYYFPDFCEDKVKDVVAWMPLSEPYKGVMDGRD